MSFRKNHALVAFAIAVLAVAGAAASQLPKLPLTIQNHEVTVEVATSENERQYGLMNRFSLGADQGMLFVFARPVPIFMWMKNTYMPLSVAFINRDGTIVNIDDMEPQTRERHLSAGPVLYALEVRKGWFKQHGITAGAKVQGLDSAPKAAD